MGRKTKGDETLDRLGRVIMLCSIVPKITYALSLVFEIQLAKNSLGI